MSTTPTTASTGVTFDQERHLVDQAGQARAQDLRQARCGGSAARRACRPTARPRTGPWESSSSAARQTSQLKAEVFMTSARIAAEIGIDRHADIGQGEEQQQQQRDQRRRAQHADIERHDPRAASAERSPTGSERGRGRSAARSGCRQATASPSPRHPGAIAAMSPAAHDRPSSRR